MFYWLFISKIFFCLQPLYVSTLIVYQYFIWHETKIAEIERIITVQLTMLNVLLHAIRHTLIGKVFLSLTILPSSITDCMVETALSIFASIKASLKIN